MRSWSSYWDPRCPRPLRPSSSCSLALRRLRWAGSTRGWETTIPAWRRGTGSFLQKLVSKLPVTHSQHKSRSAVQCSAGCCCCCYCYCCQPAVPSTYPQEARGAATEDAVRVADLGFAACRCARSAGGCGGRRALDVVVEAFDDVPGAGLFQVLRLDSQDVVFELLLRTESAPG
jgi:hypothetical protein